LDFYDPSFDPEQIFGRCGAIVFVVDAQDDYLEALKRLYMTVTRASAVNPSIYFEVFIHKVDGLSDDHKIGKDGGFMIWFFDRINIWDLHSQKPIAKSTKESPMSSSMEGLITSI
jgi:hypothetical protein